MPVLVGRASERAAAERTVDAARGGLSGALVLKGEPGIGKTALLEYVADYASDLRVVQLVGIESERELGFAALHQLLSPFLDHLDDIPGPQRTALRSAFGLIEGPVPDQMLIGLGSLSVLAAAARTDPVVCLVDDAQWLDEESARALAFVARRLYADRIAIIIAVRDTPEKVVPFDGIAEMHLESLAREDAEVVLRSAVAGAIDHRVIERVVGDAGGNPLALMQLGSELTPAQISGASLLPEPLPIGRELETRFLRDVHQLPADTQLVLLLVAADPSGDPALVMRAAADIDVSFDALDAAETSGLIVRGPTLRFRHPVIRSAVYHSASMFDRHRVHAALAAASDPVVDAHRRAWHRAAASIGADEEIASELEAAGRLAHRRGGDLAAGAFFARAAELSEDAGARARRTLAAAEADLTAGAPARALLKLDEVLPDLDPGELRARALRLQGASRFALGETAETLPILISAARALAPYDAHLARETLLDALSTAVFNGRQASREQLAEIGREAQRIALPDPSAATSGDLLLDGLAALYSAGHASAAPLLRAAIASIGHDDHAPGDALRWLGFACLAAGSLGDYGTLRDLATRLVALARERGALVALTRGLYFLALAEVVMGALDNAMLAFTEGQEIRAARGDRAGLGGVLVFAWRGQDDDALAEAESVVLESTARHQEGVLVYAEYGLAVLELGNANYPAALAHARRVDAEDSYFLSMLALPDLIEAELRGGEPAQATSACERLHDRAVVDDTPFALGMLARSRALLAEPDDAESSYNEAIALLSESGSVGQLARAYLLFGEWLRRRHRRRDARVQLRLAVELFDNIGARAFGERARVELLATGERARERTVETTSELTPQETQISRLAASGATNAEIATRLFISSSTVDYHLRKVYRKLEVTSRRQLSAVLRASG